MKKTYISLFSSAGIGCYGFKEADYECIATCELIDRRLNIQRYNNKCKYDSGYIQGDLTKDEIKKKILFNMNLWLTKENINGLDVLIATPPCQGISLANHKKNESDVERNSLVLESVLIAKKIKPKVIIFENVNRFLTTACTDDDGELKMIKDVIENHLLDEYEFEYQVVNFKDYGANSSRTRTLVIGVNRKYTNTIDIKSLYPSQENTKTLKEVIGGLPSLEQMGEIDPKDIYHSFRKYRPDMREWISPLSEGESAFDNEDDSKKPHRYVDGKIVINQRKNGDKYQRQYWDRVAPCIHTRNDILASQNTVHPKDDRVFSIRELMLLMNIPSSFKWSETTFEELNNMSFEEKTKFLKNNEINIRQSIGEAVPTYIFEKIAKNLSVFLKDVNREVNKKSLDTITNNLQSGENLIEYIQTNPDNLTFTELSIIAEKANANRVDNAAYYTDQDLLKDIEKYLPKIEEKTIRILEPSAGIGNFIPLILNKYWDKEHIVIDIVDIDPYSIEILKTLLSKIYISSNVEINYFVGDFLQLEMENSYDIVIGNPPFGKRRREYYKNIENKFKSTNIFAYFFLKALNLSKNYVSLVVPKTFLSTPEFDDFRLYINKFQIESIIDFGEKGFKGVKIETVNIIVKKKDNENNLVNIKSEITKEEFCKKQNYITNSKFPSWLLYRNEYFDDISKKMDFGIFKVFRDRQIVNKLLNDREGIRVLKSRNMDLNNGQIVDIDNYDSYIKLEELRKLSVFNYINNPNAILVPNLSYYPRAVRLPKETVVNGSIAILIPENNIKITSQQLDYFSSEEFRKFYKIARNFGTRSLNIDKNSVKFFGLLKEVNKDSM